MLEYKHVKPQSFPVRSLRQVDNIVLNRMERLAVFTTLTSLNLRESNEYTRAGREDSEAVTVMMIQCHSWKKELTLTIVTFRHSLLMLNRAYFNANEHSVVC